MALYGLASNDPLSITGLIVTILFVFKGIAGYALINYKDWAVKLAMVEAWLGIGVCLVTMLVLPFFGYSFTIRFELILIIPYLVRLWKIKSQWEENRFEQQEKLGTSG